MAADANGDALQVEYGLDIPGEQVLMAPMDAYGLDEYGLEEYGLFPQGEEEAYGEEAAAYGEAEPDPEVDVENGEDPYIEDPDKPDIPDIEPYIEANDEAIDAQGEEAAP